MKTTRITTKKYLRSRLYFFQTLFYAILLFLVVGDEVFDFPHTIFGQLATPINWAEVYIEGGYIIVLTLFAFYTTNNLLKKIKFFDGYLPICSFCKKIREEGKWISLEEYVSKHSEAMLSHGACPQCMEEHYGKYLHKNK